MSEDSRLSEIQAGKVVSSPSLEVSKTQCEVVTERILAVKIKGFSSMRRTLVSGMTAPPGTSFPGPAGQVLGSITLAKG